MSDSDTPTSPQSPANEHRPKAARVANRDRAWQSKLIHELATGALKEQRRARRWGIFFKLLTFAYLTFVLAAFFVPRWQSTAVSEEQHTAVIDVVGAIANDENANSGDIIEGLQAAFEDENTAGIILYIDSPGGSPVQSGIIYDEIKRLRADHADTPVYAVLGDICASGGYYVASAADKIFADKATIVGSIGVRMDGFGFTGLMEKLGVERRLLTSGKSKGLLDPFSPKNATEVRHVQTLLDNIHEQFIEAVREGRGDRLAEDGALFSGLIWTGEQALENGLIDELGSIDYVAREVIGVENLIDYRPRKAWLEQLSEQLGASVLSALDSLLSTQTSRLR